MNHQAGSICPIHNDVLLDNDGLCKKCLEASNK